MLAQTIVRTLRLRAKMTQTEIAASVGVKQPTIHRIECGENADTNYQTGKKLEALLRRRLPGVARKILDSQEEAA
jgi:transcriptional regulator with XRE-family HTH domain